MTKAATRRPSAPALERRQQKKSSTRREIVLAGRRLFSREGIYESRIEDITRDAGIAKGTLYLYYRSKEELLTAVVQHGFDEMKDRVRRRLEGKASLREVSEEIFRAHVLFFADNPDLLRILHQVRGLLKFARTRWPSLRICLGLYVEFLATCLARGEMRAWSPARRRELASFLFGCASGVSSLRVSIAADSKGLPLVAETWAGALGAAARAYAEQAPGKARKSSRRP